MAVAAANLPTPDNNDCQPAKRPLSVLVMNGTADPINPYNGGKVTLFGLATGARCCPARTRRAISRSWPARRPCPSNIEPLAPPAGASEQALWAQSRQWNGTQGQQVVLYTLHGAGHVLPQPWRRAPRLLGPTPQAPDGTAEMWAFLARQQLAGKP